MTDTRGGRPWVRWLLAWVTGVAGALVVSVVVGGLAPGSGWIGIAIALLGGTLVMGGLIGADSLRQWVVVLLAEVLGWLAVSIALIIVIFRMAFGPDVLP